MFRLITLPNYSIGANFKFEQIIGTRELVDVWGPMAITDERHFRITDLNNVMHVTEFAAPVECPLAGVEFVFRSALAAHRRARLQ